MQLSTFVLVQHERMTSPNPSLNIKSGPPRMAEPEPGRRKQGHDAAWIIGRRRKRSYPPKRWPSDQASDATADLAEAVAVDRYIEQVYPTDWGLRVVQSILAINPEAAD